MPQPTGEDFANYLIGTGLLLTNETEEWSRYIDLEKHVNAAYLNFQHLTGRKFIAVTETRRFDPPTNANQTLDLGADIVSVTSLTVNGVAKTEGTDFLLSPQNNDKEGRPFFMVEFLTGVFTRPIPASQRRCVAINGAWGFSLDVDDLVAECIFAGASILAYPQLALAISKGVMLWADKNERVEFSHYADQGPLTSERKAWKETWANGVMTYLRHTVGFGDE